MYDDLARAQRPSALEWFVLNAVIPSVLVTLALYSPSPEPRAPTCYDCSEGVPFILPPCGDCSPFPLGPIPDALPILISMPRPLFPPLMRRYDVEGRVVLRALVNADGRVDSTSILVVQMTDAGFVPAAFHALARALFRPARFAGHAGAAWISIAINFTLRQE